MAVHTGIDVVGVDWGTTHRRAYALDSAGQCLAEWADGEGALACKGRFPQALQELLERMDARPRRVILSGMVGSALGWQAVPYVDGTVDLPALARHMVVPSAPPPLPAAEGGRAPDVALVPGYCVRGMDGQPDVMRGEETQLLGACCLGQGDGWYVLPGTHSKWVELRDGRVRRLRTYMTGELFDLLGRHGTLAAAGAPAGGDAPWDEEAFGRGVHAAQQAGALSHQLFGCRARVVCGDMPASASRAFLSGLLIGAELHDVLREGGSATDADAPWRLLGSPALAALYQSAAVRLGRRFEVLDARAAFVAAIHHLHHATHPHHRTPTP